jgi:Phage integrase, N-terminal SAM-like domain
MTKPRRRQAGEGTISEYQTKAGPRYLIKYKNLREGEGPEWIVRRGFLTRKAAAEALGDINPEVRRGAHVVPPKITTGHWLDQWLASLRLAPSTKSSYAKNVRLHIKPQLGQIPLARLTGTKISALYRDLERDGRQDHKEGSPALGANRALLPHDLEGCAPGGRFTGSDGDKPGRPRKPASS